MAAGHKIRIAQKRGQVAGVSGVRQVSVRDRPKRIEEPCEAWWMP